MSKGINLTLIGILLFIMIFSSLYYYAIIDLQYNIDRCNNLDKNFNNYDFDHTIEIDAEYSKDCYKLRNHPFISFERVWFPSLAFSIMFTILIILMIMIITSIRDYGKL